MTAMSIPADESAAYPVFTGDQLARLRAYGTVRSVRAGEVQLGTYSAQLRMATPPATCL